MPPTRALDPAAITTDHEAYAARRPEQRAEMIPLRRLRRVRVGDMLAFSFENARTLTYQVQEMVYTERITDPAEVAHELELYGRMLPDGDSLVATLFVELTDPAEIKSELARLDGLQRAVHLEVGGQRVPATQVAGPDEQADDASPLVSVHVLRFAFPAAARDAFLDPDVPAELVVHHPAYADGTPLTGDTRRSLIEDLAR